MYQFQKHFSLEEARALLPQLRRTFREAHRAQKELTRHDVELGRRLSETGGDLGGAGPSELVRLLVALNGLLQEVRMLGLVVKDVDRGLVDFPHLRDGREVFLCWELDEDDIEFWHELDTGYAGRERL